MRRLGEVAARLKRFQRDQRGLAALEFALALPLMLTMYLGTVELSQGIGADRKVTQTARTIADLVSQLTTVTNAQMTNTLNAGAAVIAPYDPANLKIVVSSVRINAAGVTTVIWSDARNANKRANGSSVTLPAALVVPDSSLIFAEVQYIYKPVMGYVLTGTFTLNDKIYMRPRLTKEVDRKAS